MGRATLPGVRLRIDSELCTGHGRCYSIAPALFECDDDGYGQVVAEQVGPAEEADARRAAASCPERAVVLDA